MTSGCLGNGARPADAAGFSLIEVLVAMFLVMVGVLGLAPMFVLAIEGNAAGGEIGAVNAIGVEAMERLRSVSYASLDAGGSLDLSENGYSDGSIEGYVVRWTIVDNIAPAQSKTITVQATALLDVAGEPKQATLTTLRALDD